MRKVLKRGLSAFLVILIALTSVPLGGFVGISAIALNVPSSDWKKPLDDISIVTCHYLKSGTSGVYSGGRTHRGIDYSAAVGSNVYSTCDGTIISAYYDKNYGHHIIIEAIVDGEIRYFLYAHLSGYVKKSGNVNAGELIGYSGATGNVTGPHLHYEVRTINKWGNDINPNQYLPGSTKKYNSHYKEEVKTLANYSGGVKATPIKTDGTNSKGKAIILVYNQDRVKQTNRAIYLTDSCKIFETYSDGYCRVQYPDAKGNPVIFYAKTECFKIDENEYQTPNITVGDNKLKATAINVPVTVVKGEDDQFSGCITTTGNMVYVKYQVYKGNKLQKNASAEVNYNKNNVKAVDISDVISSKVDFTSLGVGDYKLKITASSVDYSQSNAFFKLLSKIGLSFIPSVRNKVYKDLIIYEGSFKVINGTSTYSLRAAQGKSVWRAMNATLVDDTPIQQINDYYNSSAVYPIGKYTVTTKAGLNIRQNPNATSGKLGALKYGTAVEVTATNGNWGYIGRGWICLDYTSYYAPLVSETENVVNYETGIYKISTNAGLYCRAEAKQNSTSKGIFDVGHQFSVTKVDGSWGYCPDYDGWFCLNYAEYVGELEPVIPVPGTPILKSATPSEIGVGDIITVTWEYVSDADSYVLNLVNKVDGSILESKTITNANTASFTTSKEGIYDVTIVAKNVKHKSVMTKLEGIKVNAPKTVTFKDWDGKVLSTQQVGYFKNATAPVDPSRVGHTFKSWSGNFKNVTEDTVVTATYTRNTYTVTFYDYDGKTVVGTQKVLYGDSATAPTYSAPTGYTFVKWDRAFDKITENISVKAVINWTSAYPLEISTTSTIYRNETTYITTAIVNNSPKAVTNAKVIVALKTAEDKQLAEVQSSAISLAAGEMKTLSLKANYDGAATVGNIFVCKADNENIPLAKHLVVSVDQGTAWSSWNTSTPPSNALKTESRTEYRYRTKSYTTSSDPNLSGWTKYNTTSAYSGWSGWSAWQDAWVGGNDLREVRTQQVTDYNNYTAWGNWSGWQDSWVGGNNLREVRTQVVDDLNSPIYVTKYHYYRFADKNWDYGSWYQSNTYYNYEEIQLDSPLTEKSTTGNGQGYKYWKPAGDFDTFWPCEELARPHHTGAYNKKTQYSYRDRNYATKTQYSYRTRTLNYTYYYYKWSDWSEWSPTSVSANADREVQTRTTYRYISNIPANVEDKSGEFVKPIVGNVGSVYAGKYALLHVYSSDGSTQYIGQQKLSTDGSYNFKFKLKNKPTVTSGDYNVTLSIEGMTTAMFLDSIKAPVPEYTVTFKNYDGSIIQSQQIKKGENATCPIPPERVGYDFTGWSTTATNIQGDTVITAQYKIKTFDVIFVDDISEIYDVVKYNYGDKITPPEVLGDEAYTFIGWDVILSGVTTVTENLVITAKYKLNSYTVTFLDYEGKEIQKTVVDYADAIAPPILENKDQYVFVAWDTTSDLEYITSDLIISPIYEYAQTVELPIANIETGSYDSIQTVVLSCATEGADIYYTLDGSDPLAESEEATAMSLKSRTTAPINGILYTGPFEIDSSAELVFIAVKDEMNASYYGSETLSVNTGHTENKQHLVTVYTGLNDDYSYSYLVNDGEMLFDEQNVPFEIGYTLEGAYKDSALAQKWDIENDKVTDSVDIYLKWIKDRYTVTFKDKDGNVIDEQDVEYGDSAIAPMWDEVEGYVFSGWDTNYSEVISDLIVQATYLSENELTKVKLSKTELNLSVGVSETLVAIVELAENSTNDHIIWQSLDSDVATVDDNGYITAIAYGETEIYAISEDSSEVAICIVNVTCNHDYEFSVTNPTCTEKGYTTHICSVCGNNYKDSEKAALGHNLGNFTVSIAPKCTSDGAETAKCTRCPYTETRTIKATGHVDKNNDGKCDLCNTKLESGKDCSCNCHKGGIAGFFFKIILFFQKLFRTNKICKCGVAHY